MKLVLGNKHKGGHNNGGHQPGNSGGQGNNHNQHHGNPGNSTYNGELPPEALFENEAMRNEYGNALHLNNNTIKQTISSVPVNYKDEQTGKFKKVNLKYKHSNGKYKCDENAFKTEFDSSFAAGRVFKLEKHGCSVALSSRDIISVSRLENDQHDGKKMTVKSIKNNADLQYVLESNKIKENIVITEKAENYEFDFGLDLQNLNVTAAEDGRTLELKNKTTGAVEFMIPGPIMYDANQVYSDLVYYEIEPDGDNVNIKVIAEAEFINADDRAFPVMIDPQIVTNNTDLFPFQVQYRDISTSSGSGTTNGSWNNSNSSGDIKVLKSSTQEYRTILTIKKSLMNLLNERIVSVKLILKPKNVYVSGSYYINGSLKYIYNTDTIEQDITNTFKLYSYDFTIWIEPYSYSNVNALFYAAGADAPILEIEYLTNENAKPVKQSFSLAGCANGELNLKTGEVITECSDVAPVNSVLGIGILHVHKKSSDNLSCGDNFRLNLHEKLVRNSDSPFEDANYVYTDSKGDKCGFAELFYYLDGDNKIYKLKCDVTVEFDGRLTYTAGGTKYEVFTEYITSSGLKAVMKLEGFKNAELFEQRSDEYKRLDEQVKGYKNALLDYAIANTGDGTVNLTEFSVGHFEKNNFDNFINNLAYNQMILPKSEGFQLKSLLIQKALLMADILSPADVIGPSVTFREKLLSLRSSIYELTATLINYVDNNNSLSSISINQSTLTATISLNSLSGIINNITMYKEFNNGPQQSGNALKSMFRQRNSLIRQYIALKAELENQVSLIGKQIKAITDKNEQYLTQIQDYYKEYCNLNFRLEQMKTQMPVNFLTDGAVYRGYNVKGNLVTISDNYENSVVIEYEKYFLNNTNKERIKRVYDGNENKEIKFEYNVATGLLASITDARGRKIKYEYTDGKLTSVKKPGGKTITIRYSGNNIEEIESSDKLLTVLAYDNGWLTGVTNKSLVKGITKAGALEFDQNQSYDDEISATTIEYTQYTGFPATIVTNDTAKQVCIFNNEGNLIGTGLEENGVVTQAEQINYVKYAVDERIKADKNTLYVSPMSSFVFTPGDTETVTLNQFNNAAHKSVSAINLTENGEYTQGTEIDYFYDNNQNLIREKATVTITDTTANPPAATEKSAVKNYYYNAKGALVRTESYVDDEEEKLAKGIAVEETIYNDKGHVVKSFAYNSLDTSSKYYTEREFNEQGQTTAEIDATGENKTQVNYVDNANMVESQTLPNGAKFAYGRDIDDRVTAITQSTEEGEENSNQTHYTKGLVTELRSGNNVVKYEYDYKRRLTAIHLNDKPDYITYTYTEDSLDNVPVDVTEAENNNDETFTTYKDKFGNIIQFNYNGTPEVSFTYDKNKLMAVTDEVSDEEITNTYDGLDRITAFEIKQNNISKIKENYIFNSDGILENRAISGAVSHNYAYEYKPNLAKDLDKTKFTRGGASFYTVYNKDCLGRASERLIQVGGNNITGEYYCFRKIGDHATNQISTIRYGNKAGAEYVIGDSLKYTYDNMGNIEKICENGKLLAGYTYDKIGRLVREDNKKLGKTYFFVYDNNGNVLTKQETDYTLKKPDEIAESELTTFKYTYAAGSDRLMSFNGEVFNYDNLGNPTTYRGKPVIWEKGRQMKTYDGHNFYYNGQGQRTSKDSWNYTYTIGGKLIKQADGTNTLEFIYDDGTVSGIVYNNAAYHYRKDAQGNVKNILDNNGAVVVEYVYDAWGNHAVLDANGNDIVSASHIGLVNPIRYRSYYYDSEINLFFLKSRYYDPETGRFVTIDDTQYIAPDIINGLNLYAYCGNNPVMRVDPNGNAWWNIFKAIGLIFAAIFVGVVTAAIVQLQIASAVVTFPLIIVHYNRNNIQEKKLAELYGENWEDNIYDTIQNSKGLTIATDKRKDYDKGVWIKMSSDSAKYHKIGMSSEYACEKYVYILDDNSSLELVFWGTRKDPNDDNTIADTENRSYLKLVTDPKNAGTYNYRDYYISKPGHFFWDVLTYWLWSNKPFDGLMWFQRIFG